MKFAAVLLLVGVVCVAALSEQDYQFLFHRFISQHGKQYGYEEFGQRFATFKHNLDLVQRHNAEAAQGKHSFTLEMNKFGDLTNDEYRARYLKLRRTNVVSGAAGTFAPSIQQIRDVPDSVDWRTKNVVVAVKDQGQCGSCWAFSAVGAMEGAHALATGNLLSLSEQELVDCVNDGADTCDMGGEMHDGYLYAIAAGGMESEASYPYTATSGNTCKFTASKVVATFSSYLNVTSVTRALFKWPLPASPLCRLVSTRPRSGSSSTAPEFMT